MGNSRRIAAVAAALGTVILAAGCGGSSSGGSSGGKDFSKVTSAASGGGMAALVTAAKAEGTLNVIALPSNWANYGAIMKGFTAKYGIKITDANPEGSSQDEINAVQQEKGQSRAPDVLDMGTSFATEAQAKGLLAPYKVATWSNIPASSKSAQGDWYADYGGYVAIGYDPSKVKTAPTSFASLLNPAYKHQVAINNNPTSAAAAFDAVWAAALANGGSFSNIAPGVTFFKKLHQEGNFVPVAAGPTTVENGSTPIVVWWDYLLASEVQSAVKGF
ncbi:MAG TPA: ABC transporter substrate-binding protein, partial [Streptosporangiaceae bacterium]|nr:ABC transporter substrate-binding protein [Streptosporangiaceae bacterium]